MVVSNHPLISLLSYSCCFVLVTSYSLCSTAVLSLRTAALSNKKINPFQRSNLGPYYHQPTYNTVLYSSNPTGKKRRRRKETTSGSNDSNGSAAFSGDDSDQMMMIINSVGTSNNIELPDFDITDDEVIPSTLMSSTTKSNNGSTTSSIRNPSTVVDPLIGTITLSMMASSSSKTNRAVTNSVVSVNELRDRSLEQKLQVLYQDDDSIKNDKEEELPDLLTLQRERKTMTTEQILLSSSSSASASSMSKKERQTLARQQQDMEQKQSKMEAAADNTEDTNNFFTKLPFITNENGKIEPIQLLETATWTCIIALIVWEVYINSPFFDRAAPIIPLVYDIWI